MNLVLPDDACVLGRKHQPQVLEDTGCNVHLAMCSGSVLPAAEVREVHMHRVEGREQQRRTLLECELPDVGKFGKSGGVARDVDVLVLPLTCVCVNEIV